MIREALLLSALAAAPAAAQQDLSAAAWDGSPLIPLVSVTQAAFDRAARVAITADLSVACGDASGLGGAVYCTDDGVIRITPDLAGDPRSIYLVAHLFGHTLQVRHGIADIALAAIRADPSREAELRGMVERQVDCLAGVLIARAGYPDIALTDLFATEPLTGPHWGADPVRDGPALSIGLAVRAEWFAVGQTARDPAACAVGGIPVTGIVAGDAAQAPR